jgi:SPP1 gp7 family putative phage head morphogenesis protein
VAEPPADPDRYDEAIRAFRRKVPMTDPEFRKLDKDARRLAFYVAGVTQARVVQEVRNSIDRAVEEGTTLEQFKEEAGGALAEAWGGEDAPRLETVFRTNVMGAYNEGRDEVFSDPDVREARPYLRYDTAGDSRVTEDICELMDGTILPADHPWWNTHWPPNHHNCRSMVTALSAEEAQEEGITGSPPSVQAAPGFGQRPSAAEGPADREPDLSSLDPDLRSILRERLE